MSTIIPDDATLDLWANVIVAKNVQTDEAILGSFDEYGEPVPANLTVTGLAEDENVECIDDYKICFNQANVVESFVCTSKVILTIPFVGYFWIKTNLGFKTVTLNFTYTNTIPVNEFIKPDGTPLSPSEFKCQVDQSHAVVTDYELVYVNVLPKDISDPTQQTVQVIVTATIVDRLGKYQDITVHGIVCP
jgi:hypothetical protein